MKSTEYTEKTFSILTRLASRFPSTAPLFSQPRGMTPVPADAGGQRSFVCRPQLPRPGDCPKPEDTSAVV